MLAIQFYLQHYMRETSPGTAEENVRARLFSCNYLQWSVSGNNYTQLCILQIFSSAHFLTAA